MKPKGFLVLLTVLILTSCENNSVIIEQKKAESLAEVVMGIEAEFSLLKEEILRLHGFHHKLLENREEILKSAKLEPYIFHGGYSANMPGGDSTLSSVVILEKTPNIELAFDEVRLTNKLDSAFKVIKNKYSNVAQVYSNSTNQVIRVFPAFDAKDLVPKDTDVTKYNFYYEADEENNPSKGPVWIPETYVDPAGRGWVLSLIHPVYQEDKLFSVLGIDLTIDQIISRYLTIKGKNLMIVTKSGDIVAADILALESLSFPPLKNFIYKEIILEDNFRIADYNLFNSKNMEVRNMANSFLVNNESNFNFSEEYSPKSAHMIQFEVIDWVLIEVNL